MPDEIDKVPELEVYKMLERLGIELGAGVVPRYGLMSAAVRLCLDSGATGFALRRRFSQSAATGAVDDESDFDRALCRDLVAISRKH
jgi:hypothetical protein